MSDELYGFDDEDFNVTDNRRSLCNMVGGFIRNLICLHDLSNQFYWGSDESGFHCKKCNHFVYRKTTNR